MRSFRQKEINNKAIITDICEDEEEIQMAVSTLVRQGEDKIARQAYLRRQDEIYFNNKRIAELEEAKHRATTAEVEVERLRKELEELKAM